MRKLLLTVVISLLMQPADVSAQLTGPVTADRFPDSKWLASLLAQHSQRLGPVMQDPAKYRLQIIYTRIDRNRQNRPSFTHHFYRVSDQYNYPASTVKLPAAVLGLEYVNKHRDKGITAQTPMFTDAIRPGEAPVLADSSSENGKPSVAHYIKKILLVSDNDAYNRLYELVGQEAFNQRLHALGFSDAQIIHRLELSLTEAENRQTNQVRFTNETGKERYIQPPQQSKMLYANRNDRLGNGYMRGGQLVPEPLDFSKKNRWPLPYIHQLVQWIMFPESQPAQARLQLTEEDYRFLQRHMAMLPGESRYPQYDSLHYWPTYVKFLYYGSEKDAVMQPGLRVYNKVGDAYGFLLDGAYFADAAKGIEFILSAVLYCNEDGILNDNKYEYETIGLPFMKQLGQVIYEYEAARKRKHQPKLQEVP